MGIGLSNFTLTYPKGFEVAGEAAGIKKSGKKDMAVIYSKNGAVASGCFTTNIVKAAPVIWDMEVLAAKNKVKAIVINSGNANACTGKQGYDDCAETAKEAGKLLKCGADEILVCSTGVIGVNLPMDKILKGVAKTISNLSATEESGRNCAEAIMTTDTYAKTASAQVEIGGKTVKFGGMAKGSGMIHPDMATMLGFVTTDCTITKEMLDAALKDCVNTTFNMITVDGDTSTNDTAIVLASGEAGNAVIEDFGEDYEIFKAALFEITRKLAIDIAKDGEGATKLMEVTVSGAKTYDDAKKIARSVTGSSLFKAALFGEDANWGRVLCAMGYSGGFFNPDDVSVYFRSYESGKPKDIMLMDKGKPVNFDEDKAKYVLKEKEIFIEITLNDGTAKATAWGCDLTYDYVKINGDYRS